MHLPARGVIGVSAEKRKRPEAGFHSLRHTFVSLCAAGGDPQSVVQALVGHGSPAMTAHYTHVGVDAAKSAVLALPDVTGADAARPASAGAVGTVLDTLAELSVADLRTVAETAQELIHKQETPG